MIEPITYGKTYEQIGWVCGRLSAAYKTHLKLLRCTSDITEYSRYLTLLKEIEQELAPLIQELALGVSDYKLEQIRIKARELRNRASDLNAKMERYLYPDGPKEAPPRPCCTH